MTRAAQWREQRRLLAAQATLQRVRLAHEAQALRSAAPAASVAAVFALGVGAVMALRRRRAGGLLTGVLPGLLPGLLRAARAWMRDRP